MPSSGYNGLVMRLDATQQLRMQQQMKLSPRIIQAMEILQLPMLALQERIEAELQSNPVLELQDPGVDAEAPLEREDVPEDRGEQAMVIREDGGQSDDFERLAEFTNEFGSETVAEAPSHARSGVDEDGRDRKLDAMANAPAPAESLDEYLLRQWALVEVPDDLRAPGELILQNLDSDGYLRTPLDELGATADPPIPPDRMFEALRWVWTLEPTGVGARNLAECLLLQLNLEAAAGKDVTLESDLVRNHLHDIELNRLPQIARRTGRSLEAIKAAIENISHLNPRPGSLIGQRAAPVILPDAIVELDDEGNLQIAMSDESAPRLYISRQYRRMADDRDVDKVARRFLQQNIRSAEWLIGAIEQRRETVRRVIGEVFTVQREFLEQGPEALRPLPMADIANKVGVHVATVSRAVAGKYVQTPQGIHPLRMFFSGGTTTSEGEDVSWDAVKAKLKEVVDNEDKAKPLNDDQIAQEMTRQGITIARRTVAKYRDLLDIPPARQRKQY